MTIRISLAAAVTFIVAAVLDLAQLQKCLTS